MTNQPVSINQIFSEALISFELKNLMNLKILTSEKFFVCGNPWHFKFEKLTDDDDDNDCLGVYLYSDFNHESNKTIIIAKFEIKLLPWKLDEEAHCKDMIPCVFSSTQNNWGLSSLVPWNQLMDPENGYIIDDKCSFGIRIKASPLKDVTMEDCVKIDTIESCDNCLSTKFRMKINCHRFHEFFAESSPEIFFKDFSFHFAVYRDENNLYYRIFKYGVNECSVSAILKLISYNANIKPKEVKANKQFDVETSNGIYHLATCKQLTDPANKFIENNAFVIEVDFKIETNEPEAKKCPKCSAVYLECPICFVNLKLVSISTITTCGHMFCTECVTESVRKNKKCPSCNADASLKSLIRIYLPTA